MRLYERNKLQKRLLTEFLVFLLASCWLSFADSDQAYEEADINFMVYMLGSDIEEQSGAASNDILEMLRVSQSQSTHIYVMAGGSVRWAITEAQDGGTTIMELKDGMIEVMLSEKDGIAATSETLVRFLQACYAATPSGTNYLVLWGHGCEGMHGVGYDAPHDDDTLTLTEICEAIEKSKVPIDILGFDACGMATETVVGKLSGKCKHILASEQTIDLNGWPYRQIIEELTGDPDLDGRSICESVAQNTERSGKGFILKQLF